ncbi:MAG: hypothetical protein LC798_13105 [Chloroflexi bacterium]|nr:hypothetical protein [Chloroflexota bacterium]
MSRARVVGGAADGCEIPPHTLRWIDPEREMGFVRQAPGRFPYHLKAGCYVPALTCPDCGSILDADRQGIRPDPCPLCGHDRYLSRGGADGRE